MQTLHNSTKTHTLAGNLIQKKLPDRSNCRNHLIHTDIARQKMLGGYLEIYVAVIMIKISSCIHSILLETTLSFGGKTNTFLIIWAACSMVIGRLVSWQLQIIQTASITIICAMYKMSTTISRGTEVPAFCSGHVAIAIVSIILDSIILDITCDVIFLS